MELETCLELLRANSNENKLVGLLLVTKFVPSPGSDSSVLRQIADAIGFAFLNRMLNTTGLCVTLRPFPNLCPWETGSISEGLSFRGLALSVFSTFSLDPELIGREGFVKGIPGFASALSSEDPHESLDALRCLVGAAQNPVAIDAMVECGVLRKVALSITPESAVPEKGEYPLPPVSYDCDASSRLEGVGK